MSITPAERRLRASVAASVGWANTTDRAARGRHGQKGLYEKFLREAPPEITHHAARRKYAESRMRAHYQLMAYRSMRSRRLRKEAEEREAEQLKAARASKTRGNGTA